MKRWKSWLAEERAKTQDMSLSKRLSYIWDYYKIYITVIVCVLTIGVYVGVKANTVLSDHWFYIGFTGTTQALDDDSDLYDGYVSYSGYDLTQKLVEFDNRLYFDYAQNKGRGNRYYEIFCAYVDSATLDACTMSVESMESLGASGRLLDLNSETCASIREKYGDRFIYCTPIDEEYSQDPVPIGIDISDSILMTDYQIYEGSCALGIGANSKNIEAVEKFLDYLYEEEK